MPSWAWLITQSVGMVLYGAISIPVLLVLSDRLAWNWWVAECAMDAVMIPYFVIAAIAGYHLVDAPFGVWFFVVDWMLALYFAWHTGRAYDRHHQGKWSRSLISKMLGLHG